MSPTPANALVESVIASEQIGSLATLYDRFAHALDPFSPERDEAERTFMQEVAGMYDFYCDKSSISFHDFCKAVIVRCKRHLAANNKPQSV